MLDIPGGALVYGEGRAELTKNELRILQALMEKHGSVVSRDALMLRLWQTDSFVDENTLTVNVTRLRRKLGGPGPGRFYQDPQGPGLYHRLRGRGAMYILSYFRKHWRGPVLFLLWRRDMRRGVLSVRPAGGIGAVCGGALPCTLPGLPDS